MDLESEKITGGTGESAKVDNLGARVEGAGRRDAIGVLTNLDKTETTWLQSQNRLCNIQDALVIDKSPMTARPIFRAVISGSGGWLAGALNGRVVWVKNV